MAMAPRATLLLAVSFLAMAAVASAHGASETCTSHFLSGFKFSKCLNVLDILKVSINEPYDKKDCCPLIAGLVDLEAALCLCKKLYLPVAVPVLGVDQITLAVRVVLDNCDKYCPTDFKCPPPTPY